MSQEIDRGKRHDITAVDRGLVYLAMSYGKARKASRKMAEGGLDPVPPAALDYWKKVAHVARYEQLRQEMEKRRDLDAAERMDALVSKALDLEEKILDQTAEKLDKIDARDLPKRLQEPDDRHRRPPRQERPHQGQAARGRPAQMVNRPAQRRDGRASSRRARASGR